MSAETRYAQNGDVHLAFQVEGKGPLEVLELSNGTNISIDETSEEPHWERYVQRLTTFSRLIRFDLRGVGLSDPLSMSETPTLESTVDDALAVLDAAGATRVALFGPAFGGAVAMMLAATHPQLVSSLVLINSTARWLSDHDYPFGFDAEAVAQWSEATIDTTGTSTLPEQLNDAVIYAASLADDPGFRQWWARAARRGASPAAARALSRLYTHLDVRAVLPAISVPTLVVHRTDQFLLPISHARYLADHIRGAKLVTLPGRDSLPYSGDIEELIGPIEEFLTGERQVRSVDRVLATIMFSDIVGSTQQVAELGDRRWQEIVSRHDAMVQRQIERFRGKLIKQTGDGVLATFDAPARAISCASAIVAGGRQLGITLRVGLHSGEVGVVGADITGIAVHTASRVADLADPDEILVSRTVTDLVAGSGIKFEDRGTHALRGVPGDWQLFAAVQE